MKTLARFFALAAALSLAALSEAQEPVQPVADIEELQHAALDALIAAPPERALPLVQKVLSGNHSLEMKERALFILSQIDRPEAVTKVVEIATTAEGDLRLEAIRMIGISGNTDSLEQLRSIYDGGNGDVREAVLEAYMIADDTQSVYDIATQAEGDDFEAAVETLGVMDARDELRQLLSQTGASEALIEAYALSGDFQSLQQMASDSSNVAMQIEAIEAMGLIDEDQAGPALVRIFENATTESVREAAVDGLMLSDNDGALLQLYRSADDVSVKKMLLETLVMMGSDEVWDAVDAALDDSR